MRVFRVTINVICLITCPIWTLPVFTWILVAEFREGDKDTLAWAKGERFLFFPK